MTNISTTVNKKVKPIWCINGKSGKIDNVLHPLGFTLKNKAIGIDMNAPIIAALELVFFQNKPKIKIANIPGETTPVHSCINWNACSILPSIGATNTAITKPIKPDTRPTETNFSFAGLFI